MKTFTGIVLVMLVFSANACMTTENKMENHLGENPSMTLAWTTSKGLEVPESVIFDEKNQVLYVSNISGKPTLKNNKGFISKVGLDGSIETLDWVTGLNAPKGMGIFWNFLYVTDIDRIHRIDIPSGTIIKTWDVQGAKFLNDIAIDDQGTVFITDMVTQSIHRIKTDQMEPFLDLDYIKPNGLFMRANTLLVGTAQGIVAIDIQDKSMILDLAHQGGIDGIKPVGPGRYIVSDWKGKIQIIEKGKAPVILLDTSAQKINAADFEYIPDKNLVIVPTFFANSVTAYLLK